MRHKVARMKIASLGAGRMASSLLGALVEGGFCAASDICVTSRTRESRSSLADHLRVNACDSLQHAVSQADIVLVCVKPADVGPVLAELSTELSGKLLVSVAAGITLESLAKWAPGARIIRAMPNTPAEIAMGVTALSFGALVTEDDRSMACQIFESVGEVVEIDESLMDAVTALSGSGPAYFFLFFEALTEAGVALGLPRETAQKLAIQTGRGAAELAFQSGREPAQLRHQVTSPKGTTAAALEVFESTGLRNSVAKALEAAARRSKELSQPGGRKA